MIKTSEANENEHTPSTTRARIVNLDEQCWMKDCVDDFVKYLKDVLYNKEQYMKPEIIESLKVSFIKRLCKCCLSMSFETYEDTIIRVVRDNLGLKELRKEMPKRARKEIQIAETKGS